MFTATKARPARTTTESGKGKTLYSDRAFGVHARVIEVTNTGKRGSFQKPVIYLDRVFKNKDSGEIEHTSGFDLDEALIAHRLLGQAIDAAIKRADEIRKERFADGE